MGSVLKGQQELLLALGDAPRIGPNPLKGWANSGFAFRHDRINWSGWLRLQLEVR